MPISKTNIRRRLGQFAVKPATPGPADDRPAPLSATLGLTVILTFGGFLTLMGLVLLVNHPTPIPDLALSLSLKQNQDAESFLYLAAFVGILPLALVVGPRLADRIANGPNSAALTALTGCLAVALLLAIISVKASRLLPWGDGIGVALCAFTIWSIGSASVIWRASQPRAWVVLLRLSGAATALWTIAGVLVLGTLLCLTDLGSVSPVALLLGAALVAGIVLAFERLRLPSPGQPLRLSMDILLIVIVLLAVPDLVVVRPEDASGNLAVSLENVIIQGHQNYLLGPANQVLAGQAMLVDTTSQYGVGSIYLIAGWFEIAPIGYGTLGFLSGGLSALAFAAGYAMLRMAGTSRLLAAGTLAVAVTALVFNTDFPIDSIPQDSTLRLGLPMGVIVALVAAERWPHYRSQAWALMPAVAGISSIWSLEGFVYTLAVLASMVCLQACLRRPGDRIGWAARQALLAAIACTCAHLLFAGITLAAVGQLPDWGQYIAHVRAFLFGRVGDINYDFASWSPGLAVGAGYMASVAAIVLLMLRKPDFVRAERTAMVALTGTTAYGVAIYSYFDNRSTTFVLTGVALPALLAAALWLALLLRSDLTSRGMRRGGLAFALSVAVLLVAVGWSSIGGRYPRSALAYAIPGGEPFAGAIHRLWHLPPLNSAAAEGQRLLARDMPGQRDSLVLVTPDLATEILIRAERGNELPIAAPWGDSFIAPERLPSLSAAVTSLRAGDRMLIDRPALKRFKRLREQPSIGPPTSDSAARDFAQVPVLAPLPLAPLQTWALKLIGDRFNLRTVDRGASGLMIVGLVPRHCAAGSRSRPEAALGLARGARARCGA